MTYAQLLRMKRDEKIINEALRQAAKELNNVPNARLAMVTNAEGDRIGFRLLPSIRSESPKPHA